MSGSIKFLIMDVDGTLTDGKIYMGVGGELMKAFDIKDGCGIKDILPTLGIVPIIITARKSEILEQRCKELNIENLFQGVRDKTGEIQRILKRYSDKDETEYTYASCAYIGDDILDLPPIRTIKAAGGLTACPADAAKEVRETVDIICANPGGSGAVREFIEILCGGGVDRS